jgi:type II secretory pathway component PulM
MGRYTVMRLLIFFGCLVLLWLVFEMLKIEGQDKPLVLVAGAAILSAVVSWFVLREPREQMSERIAEKVEARRARHELDDAAEDVEDEQG